MSALSLVVGALVFLILLALFWKVVLVVVAIGIVCYLLSFISWLPFVIIAAIVFIALVIYHLKD